MNTDHAGLLLLCDALRSSDGVESSHYEYPGYIHLRDSRGRNFAIGKADSGDSLAIDAYPSDEAFSDGSQPGGCTSVPSDGDTSEVAARIIATLATLSV
jgi:hypothetical protein